MKLFRNFILTTAFFFLISSCKTTEAGINIRTKVRYIEMYESICCPRDYKHDNNIKEYINNFENKNSVDLKSNFKMSLGREGEAAYFLSLSNLSKELREQFVNERTKTLKTDDKSIISHLKKPILIKEALKMWENKAMNSLIKF
jgi:hypothetical protein